MVRAVQSLDKNPSKVPSPFSQPAPAPGSLQSDWPSYGRLCREARGWSHLGKKVWKYFFTFRTSSSVISLHLSRRWATQMLISSGCYFLNSDLCFSSLLCPRLGIKFFLIVFSNIMIFMYTHDFDSLLINVINSIYSYLVYCILS